MSNPLRGLSELGQSVWLDFVSRDLMASGELQRLIDEDALKGVTSNPSIFEKAIGAGTDYDGSIARLLGERDRSAGDLYEALAIEDIRAAADILRPVFDATRGVDGYISLEVSPCLARDPEATLEEARRLWVAVDRPNLMVKVPATPQGVPAIETLIAEGINVNVTLLFAHAPYGYVAAAYVKGLERLVGAGGDPAGVASVASFFVSRIDVAANALIDQAGRATSDPATLSRLERLRGKVAIANAKVAHALFGEIFSGARWKALADRGARPQRILWASTGTKDPALSDVLYIEELAGSGTVNTMPPATLAAFRDHGVPRPALAEDPAGARAVLDKLAEVGIDLDGATDALLSQALDQFVEAFDGLLGAVAGKRLMALGRGAGDQAVHLPPALRDGHEAALAEWTRTGGVRRLWAKDARLWTGGPEARWLGWLDVEADAETLLPPLRAFARDVEAMEIDTVLLLGMGGSSLGTEVLGRTFGDVPGWPRLLVLDSTDPAQIRTIEAQADPRRTLHIVSSKSGGTLEPNILKDHFFERARAALDGGAAGRFVAVTDPGSSLEAAASGAGFARIFHGRPDIGGRYSVLSNFGLVPAAAAGVDVGALLASAARMSRSCAASVPPALNPGVSLGLALGVAARAGRDKLTIVAGPGLAAFGAWLEQLVAESTGKQGRGIIPVDAEPLGPPDAYGSDRVFVHLALAGRADGDQERRLDALRDADHPVIRITLGAPADLGGEFLRWEIATAVAGAALGLDPFDQPDVEAAKIATKALTDAYERTGALEEEPVALRDGDIRVLGDAPVASSLEDALRAHLDRIVPGDYAAILAYVERSDRTEALLREIRLAVRDAHACATCVGFGPRFLHSTGQAYKGGPNSAVVLQITADDAQDIPVPGRAFSFGVVKAAQAQGDLQVLRERGRRTLHVHLGPDVERGLGALRDAVVRACDASVERRLPARSPEPPRAA